MILNGPEAFYNKADYVDVTTKELASLKALTEPVYKYETENKICRIAKKILALIIFPIAIYKFLHKVVGLIFLPAAVMYSSKKIHADIVKNKENDGIAQNTEYKIKRISIEVNGTMIDAVILGKPENLNNGRWILQSLGNGETYEHHIYSSDLSGLQKGLDANVIMFNYPSVGASKSLLPDRKKINDAYRAVLSFLEDKDKGIGAKQIIAYGHSIGAAVQAEALSERELKDDIDYLFIKSRTFSNMALEASSLLKIRFLGFLVKIFGWNINATKFSERAGAKEIIMQTIGSFNTPLLLKNSNEIIDDDIIPGKASLAKYLLDKDIIKDKDNKHIVGISERHNYGLNGNTVDYLVEKSKELLNI